MLIRAALFAAALFTAAPALAGPMTAGERQRLIAHLEMTEAWLVSELAGLSDAQLTYKIAPEVWSIQEVAEHLAIAEPQYWTNLLESLKTPVKEGFKPEATDAAMLWYGIDRTNRTTTGDARVPHGAFANAKASLASFLKLRQTMMAVAKASPEDFRGRSYMGASQDLYQWFLMISTHSQRHVLQIREVKANPGYPKQ